MQYTHSQDGTRLAFDRIGDGPPIVTVVGAFNEHTTAVPLAQALASHFSVYVYDRRGRGESGDTLPYSVEHEIEDLAALLEVAGGAAGVFGYSSGAILCVRAAAAGVPMHKLALFDAPYMLEPDKRGDHAGRLDALVSAGKRGEAVEYFQAEMVGIPRDVVTQLRNAPFRPALEAMAHTLVYEARILGDGSLPDPSTARRVRVPTLAIAGAGMPIMPPAAEALAKLLPNARARILADQNHDINPALLAPILEEFFAAGD
jgi:pimeloyl-ACP methyl ester carboxylesterase